MASEVKLYALIPRKSWNEPVDQSSGAWFPSLKLIASQALAKPIIKRILTIGAETGLRKTAPWIEIQTLLHESLPQLLLEEIYKNYFDTSVELPYNTCGYCEGILKKVVNFNLWHEVIRTDNIVHKVIAWKLFHGSDVPHKYMWQNLPQLDYCCNLSNHSLNVTEIKLDTSKWNLEDFEEALKGLPYLRSIDMRYNTEDREGKEFELMSQFCKLEKFSINKGFSNLLPNCRFIKFLESQSNYLKELKLNVTISYEQKRFWEVLTQMPNLKKLSFEGYKIPFQNIPDLEPCQQISSLLVDLDEEQDFHTLEIDHLFPNLNDLHLNFLTHSENFDLTQIKEAEFMKKVTTMKFFSCFFNFNPFELMSCVPNAQKIELVTGIGGLSFRQSLLPAMLHLTELDLCNIVEEEYPFTQEEFSEFFRSLPNIVKMKLRIVGLHSYQEDKFTKFVDVSVNSLKKLRVLHLQFYDHPPSMTGKTVCAIVKNSCLKEFKDLSDFKFTSADFEHLNTLARKQQLVITPGNGKFCHHYGHKFHSFRF